MSQSTDFLKKLLSTPTPSGYERPGQDVVEDYLETHADSIRRDVHGNLHAVLNPKAKMRVMLAGHCDEIGLMLMHIDEKGFLYFASVGGVYVPLLMGERVTVHSGNGPVHGVVGVKPIHLMDPKERESAVAKIHELWIDIGAKNKKDAERYVRIGDVATVDRDYQELANGNFAARGLDDRIGVFVVAEAFRLLAEEKRLNVAVHLVSTVQEEVGLRGATTAAFGVDPHVGIAVDVGFATDFPGADPKKVGEAKLGGGPILHCGPNINLKVEKLLASAAKRLKMSVQMQPSPRSTGTDANAIQLSRAGVAAGLVSIPNRYMHSSAEMVNREDVENAARLIARFVRDLKSSETFIP